MMSKKSAMVTPQSQPDSWGNIKPISREEFSNLKDWIYGIAGINLAEHKQALVMGRLQSRLRHHQLTSYGEYYRLLIGGKHPGEQQVAIDLLTTNETYFFREPKHFDFLRQQLVPAHKGYRTLRVWSAAGSTGEEAYSIAMVLAATMGNGQWEVLASDLSSRVLERAKTGHYAMKLAENIPTEYLRAYCLKGKDAQDGTFVIDPKIRSHVQFMSINLNDTLPQIGEFDVIFIRNVMIYFDVETKRKVISRILKNLKSGGHLIIGHSESLYGVSDQIETVVASIYRKP